MFIKIISTCFSAMLLLGLAASSFAQNTVVTQNADGTYSVIEYPVGKEVMVNLLPGGTLTGSKGTAHVIRTASGTKVVFDVSGLPATGSYYAYAIDPSGTPTLLGPLTVNNGIANATFTTPMNQFMLAIAPTETWSSYVPTESLFTSELPAGYTVVPRRTRTAAVVAVGGTPGANQFAYNVPLLNVPAFGEDERSITLKFPEYNGLEARIGIDREKGTTKVTMNMENMKRAPETKRFVLWTYSPEGKYVKLGQIINNGRRDDTKIASETALKDFGLFVTVEDADVEMPTSQVYQVVKVS